jgi:hypothetical protein
VKKRYIILISTVGVLAVAALLIYIVPSARRAVRTGVTTTVAHVSPLPNETFPNVDTNSLSPDQVRLLQLAQAEYAKHPVSYDETVLAYTEGNKEAWCADFASWLMRATGHPYTNPFSASWRIPGVYTLQEYYQAEQRYVSAGSYKPQPGDVAFYIGRHTADLFSTSHVAVVVKVDSDQMTTLGGNEGGHLHLSTQPIKAGVNSLVGFGQFN